MSATDELRGRLQRLTGWELGGSRQDLFDAALARAAASARRSTEDHARHLVEAGGDELTRFVEDMAVGETYFFRDPAQWQLVETVVVPAALARRSRERVRFRAWSAGCSSGEEPYTLAIILAELGLETRSAIVASDISAAALGRARAGEYSSWSLRGGSDPRAARWLHEDRGLLRVDPRLRSTITFLELNLAVADLPDPAKGLSDLDLILCRNVLLYLTPDVVGRVASRLFECLAPGGFLLTSPSDPSLSRHAPFAVASGAFGIAYERPRTASARPLSAPRTAPRVAQTVARAHPLRAREQAVSRATSEAPRPPRSPLAGLRAAPSTASRLAVPPLPDACPGCRALVDAGRLPEALELVTAAVRENPLAPELHLLEAIIMADLGRLTEAEAACRKGLYLDRSDPFLHFFLGTVLLRRRRVNAAAAALRAAARLAEGRDPDEQVAWSEGMTARELAAAARWQLERLQGGVPAGAGS